MKSRVLSFAIFSFSALGLASAAHAGNDVFAGIEAGTARTDLNVKTDDGYKLIDGPENSGYFGIRFGAYLQPNFRVTGVLGYSEYDAKGNNYGVDNKKNVEIEVETLEMMAYFDYVHNINESIALFAGPHIGFTSISVDYDFRHKDYWGSGRDYRDNYETESKSSFSYGAQAGSIYKLNDHFSVEAGVRYTVLNYDEKLDDDWNWSLNYKNDDEFHVKAKDMTKFYLSANYHF